MKARLGIVIWLLFLLQLHTVEGISSDSVKHLEPVVGVRLNFKEESSSARKKREEAALQPFPSSLALSFEAFGTSFSFELDVFADLTQGASISFHGENDTWVEERPLKHKVYRGSKKNELGEELGWINLVAHEDGLFDALFLLDGELYSIDPLSLHAAELDTKAKRDLEAVSDLVIYKDSDSAEGAKLCGSVSAEYMDPLGKAHLKETPEEPSSSSSPSSSETPEAVYHPQGKINRNLLTVARWTDCFPNNAVTRRMDIAFYLDYGYYKAIGSTQAKAEENTLSILSRSNIIYYVQVNVFLFPGRLTVKTGPTADTFNQVRGSCTDTDTTLDNFRAWRVNQANENDGTYHLLTDCYPPPGVVGLAYVGVLCLKSYGAGWSTFHSTTWKTVAHEIGHNFGANHAFQLGQGKTGGIMDYGDGTLNGEYQFHTTYNKDEVCAEITSSMAATGSGNVKNCWKNFVPQCGNGVLEPGEDCDDDSFCCQGCKFITGGQCSGGPCCQGCQFAPSTTNCGIQGYCANGVCTSSVCASYSNVFFCANPPTDPCQQTCTYEDGTECLHMDVFSIDGSVANGVVCKATPLSTCQAGACQVSTAPFWVMGSWSPCTKACGDETTTRSVTCQSPAGATLADSQCPSPKPASSVSCRNPSCDGATFAWVSIPGPCNTTTCTVSNTVFCQMNGERNVSEALCPGSKPPVTKGCCTTAAQKTGMAVGISVGVIVLLAAIGASLFYFLYFKKRGASSPSSSAQERATPMTSGTSSAGLLGSSASFAAAPKAAPPSKPAPAPAPAPKAAPPAKPTPFSSSSASSSSNPAPKRFTPPAKDPPPPPTKAAPAKPPPPTKPAPPPKTR